MAGLNDMQDIACRHVDGPLLILAGAGSGKTRVLTHRVARLISEEGVRPYNILAITFTNKAAREMRERVNDIVGYGAEQVWVSTFHSMCVRILRRYADRIGYTNEFAIYDTDDEKRVIKDIMKQFQIDPKRYPEKMFMAKISDAKEKYLSPDEFESEHATEFVMRKVADVYREYQSRLKRYNAMDFDDLIFKTIELFEHNPDVLFNYQERFKYIMVDEYQDTNYMQYRIIRLLAEKHRNICVVGDDDQCIYQWRGADIRNILSFEKDFPGTEVVKLEQNYRSCGNILKAAHSVIRHNRGRKDKQLWTEAEDGNRIMYRRLDNEKAEAAYAAQEIGRLMTAGRKYSDFAVLYRTNVQSRAFEDAFMAADVPYRVLGGTKFYDRKEIKDMMAYLRLVLNPADDLAFVRIINEPKRSVGAKTLEKLQILAQQRQASLFELLTDDEVISGLSAKAGAGLHSLIRLLAECHANHDEMKVSDIYDRLLVDSGYLKALEDANTVEADGRIENLLEFKSVMYDSEEENPQLSLAEFLESVALVADIDNHEPEENAVVLMTLHSAKGLEFPVVFMPGMEDGLFPGWRSLDSADGVEEERRLCYVGITRARERLYLTSAVARTIYGRTDFTRESQFLKELDRDLFDEEADPIGKNSYQEGGGNIEAKPKKQYGAMNKPFDQLKYIRQSTSELAKTASDSKEDFGDGDRVSHPKFGEGLVISVKGGAVTVAFDSVGIKKLALDFAPLKKI